MKEEHQNQMSTKETVELFSSSSRIWDSWNTGIRTKHFEMFFIDNFYTSDLLLDL